METYIILGNYTQEGVSKIKVIPARIEAARKAVEAAGGIAAAYLLTWIRIQILEERTHLIEYGLVAALIHMALKERQLNGKQIPVPAAQAVVTTALLGILDEDIQVILINRVCDIRDVGFNALAGLMAIGASLALTLVRRWHREIVNRGD